MCFATWGKLVSPLHKVLLEVDKVFYVSHNIQFSPIFSDKYMAANFDLNRDHVQFSASGYFHIQTYDLTQLYAN